LFTSAAPPWKLMPNTSDHWASSSPLRSSSGTFSARDLPGRVDRYEFDTTGRTRFGIINGTGPCEDVVVEIRPAADQESWRTAQLGICGDHHSIQVPLSTDRTVILVFSRHAKLGTYSFTVNPN
jgi:hypothetical protein